MDSIVYIDRLTGKRELERVYGGSALKFLYGHSLMSKLLGRPLATILAKCACFSAAYGWWQKQPWTAGNIQPFINKYRVDASEFLEKVDTFKSFNDFFIRKLKAEARPITSGAEIAIIPADGRYLFHPRIDLSDGFVVKGEKFRLDQLLQDPQLAAEYSQGSMVMARLCPTDYHRFHFPCDCTPSQTRLINGWLYSVNPIAIKQNIDIFTQNKRTICTLQTEQFGKVLFMEIGATNVGSINQTYTPNQKQAKGAEKGYFAFGGSALIVLFPPGSIAFEADLVEATNQGLEILCQMGQPMGKG